MAQQSSSLKRGTIRRELLVRAAAEQFHRHGVNATALADIARAADVPPGNMFYYFRTKDALAEAVAGDLSHRLDASLAELDRASANPDERLRLLLERTELRGEAYATLGCPLAGIARDLRQLGADPAVAKAPLERLTTWVERQLDAAGDRQAQAHALFLVAALQGAFVLAHAAAEVTVIAEVRRCVEDWLVRKPA